MSELDIELQLDWIPTWYGYEHRHSDYQITVFDNGEALGIEDADASVEPRIGSSVVLEAKDWPHPILEDTTLVGALAWVSRNEGFTWSRFSESIEADENLTPGMILAGIAAIAVGSAIWALLIVAAWLILR